MIEPIPVDEHLLAEALRITNIADKRQVVEEGLKILIQVRRQEPLRQLRGQLHWEGRLDEIAVASGENDGCARPRCGVA